MHKELRRSTTESSALEERCREHAHLRTCRGGKSAFIFFNGRTISFLASRRRKRVSRRNDRPMRCPDAGWSKYLAEPSEQHPQPSASHTNVSCPREAPSNAQRPLTPYFSLYSGRYVL